MWVGACALRESLKMASFNKDIDFSSMRADSDVTGSSTGLYWLNPPRLCSVEVGKGLKVTPTSGSDYWRKTYEDPPASRATGNGLVTKIPAHVKRWSVSTVLSMSLVDQYDQAGLMVYVDDLHWLKAGIEYECGSPNMSSVVTNGESDWNYFPWSSVEEVVLRAELERCGSVLACKVHSCSYLHQYHVNLCY